MTRELKQKTNLGVCYWDHVTSYGIFEIPAKPSLGTNADQSELRIRFTSIYGNFAYAKRGVNDGRVHFRGARKEGSPPVRSLGPRRGTRGDRPWPKNFSSFLSNRLNWLFRRQIDLNRQEGSCLLEKSKFWLWQKSREKTPALRSFPTSDISLRNNRLPPTPAPDESIFPWDSSSMNDRFFHLRDERWVVDCVILFSKLKGKYFYFYGFYFGSLAFRIVPRAHFPIRLRKNRFFLQEISGRRSRSRRPRNPRCKT